MNYQEGINQMNKIFIGKQMNQNTIPDRDFLLNEASLRGIKLIIGKMGINTKI